MRVVITNDDGISSRGLDVLAGISQGRGWETIVIAPASDMSGTSAAITNPRASGVLSLDTPSRTIDAADRTYSLAGPPGLATLVACRGGIGEPPDLVLSGVNVGLNTGHSVLHSGTVGAALTAASFGVSAMAVSLEVSEPMVWDRVLEPVEEAIDLILAAARVSVLNVNVPSTPRREAALRWAPLDRFGTVRVAVGAEGDTMLQLQYQSGVFDPGSDAALVAGGSATVTAIEGVHEVPRRRLGQPEEVGYVTERIEALDPSSHRPDDVDSRAESDRPVW